MKRGAGSQPAAASQVGLPLFCPWGPRNQACAHAKRPATRRPQPEGLPHDEP
jgi:hypothetical protein